MGTWGTVVRQQHRLRVGHVPLLHYVKVSGGAALADILIKCHVSVRCDNADNQGCGFLLCLFYFPWHMRLVLCPAGAHAVPTAKNVD